MVRGGGALYMRQQKACLRMDNDELAESLWARIRQMADQHRGSYCDCLLQTS